MSATSIEKTKGPVQEALEDAGLKAGDIDEVILVGGMTRMPAVQKMVGDCFGKEPAQGRQPGRGRGDRRRDPGRRPRRRGEGRPPPRRHPADPRHRDPGRRDDAAHRAQHDHPDRQEPGLLDRVATTSRQVEIHVLQGERDVANDNKSLGRFILDGIPPAPRGIPQVEVTFDIDANGILNVKAKDRATCKEQQVRITASSMLSKDDVDKMVREAETHADEDKKRREEVELRNQAEQLTYQAERTIKDLGDKVTSEDKATVETQVFALREALKGSDTALIQSGMTTVMETLNRVAAAAYQAASAAGEGAEGGAEGDPSDAGPDAGAGDETVEGEFKEV